MTKQASKQTNQPSPFPWRRWNVYVGNINDMAESCGLGFGQTRDGLDQHTIALMPFYRGNNKHREI